MVLRILHTADLHLGKRLHEIDLIPFQEQFLDWLLHYIEKEKIGVLLISGDIFDQANPANEARKLYFRFLSRLIAIKCKAIITGGNHDSPQGLNAPADLLNGLDIHVIGHVTDDLDDCLVPITSGKSIAAGIVAMPFLRDGDLRKFSAEATEADRLEQIRTGIKLLFAEAEKKARSRFGKVPLIAMGHLYVQGASTSESEREIQVGNLAGFEAGGFPAGFDYVALGHIHRPQSPDASRNIHYSGSPYPLSFSERDDSKRILLLEVAEGGIQRIESVAVPQNVLLTEVKGSLEEIKGKLMAMPSKRDELTELIEVNMIEERDEAGLRDQLEQLIAERREAGLQIVKYRFQFSNRARGIADLYSHETSIEELRPAEVFERKLSGSQYDEESRQLLLEAYNEILQELGQEEGKIS